MVETAKIKHLTPPEVNAMLQTGDAVLIDVREPQEYAAGHIQGALNHPLSTFDPKALPTDRAIVLQCGSGKRSATAVDRCQQAGVDIDCHLAGGIAEWTAAGLPTTRPAPGVR
ncbi:MAG: rhodanese-like domain-containing protein [Phenylobacterium sp.]